MRRLHGLLAISLIAISCGRPESPQRPENAQSSAPSAQPRGSGDASLSQPAPVSRRPTPAVETAGDLAIPRGGTARLVLRVSLPKGLHVQSDAPSDPNLIATALTVTVPKDVTVVSVVYPKPILFSQPAANLSLDVFESEFEIVVTLRAAATTAPGALVIPAALRYQACNDSICFAPATIGAEWKVQVT